MHSVHADMTLGVHPFRPATKLVESFTPLADYLSEKTGQKFEVRVSTDYATHLKLTGTDALDVAYLGPAPYVAVTKKYGKKPLLARQVIHGSPLFHGKIFVRAQSPIRSLGDLAGKRFVFGDPNSTMSSLLPQYMLWQAGVTADKLAGYKHVMDHVNATLAVLAGEFDAGAVKEDVFFEYEARGLRALATTPGISDHLFVARSNLPEEIVERIREAMLTILEEPDGAAIVGAITPGVTNLIQVEDRHYDNLRVILDKLDELGVAR
jgi:phosphonate transport system substrate-binding protein